MSGPEDRRCWGIYRELAHSPGRETDDAEILRATAGQLESKGFSVTLKTTEEIAETVDRVPRFLFVMCERLPILERLRQWAERGTRQVNDPHAIRNTYRDREITLFLRDRIPFPPSILVPTGSPLSDSPDERGFFAGCWVKRADVHNTQEGDVVFASDRAAIERALSNLSRRGIERAVLQEHVPGDLIKFYGVGRATPSAGVAAESSEENGETWFQWFYHREQRLAGHRFDPNALAMAAARAAASLGLEVYGGDAIATPEGRIVLIDLNAWPSFALYREVAASRIASYLAARFARDVEVLR